MEMDRRLLVLALGMFALGTDMFVVAGVLPEISRGFNVSIGAAGQMTTVYAISYALLAPIIATFAAHIPRKRLLLTALGVFVIANLGTALAPTFGIALATRALAGLGGAMFSPAATGSAASIVPPERRGFALSVVIAGLAFSTTLGAPIGTLIGGLGDWRLTMVFVSALAGVAGIGVWIFLSHIPMGPAITLGKRLAPLADARVGLVLATTFLFLSGVFAIYTYFSVVFDRAIGGNTAVMAGLFVLWGVAGTASTLMAGRLIDVIGNRKVLVTMGSLVMIDYLLLPWTSTSLWATIPAVLIWGVGWGVSAPNQHRIVSIVPQIAPIVLGLNNSATFLGTTLGSIVGAAGIKLLGGHQLCYIAAAFTAAAIIVSELAARKIVAFNSASARGTGAAIAEQLAGRPS